MFSSRYTSRVRRQRVELKRDLLELFGISHNAVIPIQNIYIHVHCLVYSRCVAEFTLFIAKTAAILEGARISCLVQGDSQPQ
jgi:hypothetical protein